ncbi:hypothetical protein B0H11DRAFT_1931419 [Mycena galericulata]|nr:hypothetical protein B0H11DRAFT_1931419 [Mycena galericulata]
MFVRGASKKICARAEVRIFARAGPKSRGAEHAVGAKLVDGIKLAKSRAGRPKKASLRGGVKCLRGGNKCASGPPYADGMFRPARFWPRARENPNFRARANFLRCPPHKHSLDEQRYAGDRQRQAVLSCLGVAWINQWDGYGMAELLSIPLTPVVNVFVFFRAD